MLSQKIVEWLLEEENPSVRYYTLTGLMGRPPDDSQVMDTHHSIMAYGLVPEILEKQNSDGSFGIPEKFYTLKYTGTVWVLLLLAELSADPADPRIRNACEFILQHSLEPISGGFSYMQSAKTGDGLASGVFPCLTGNMVYSLIKLGYLEDSRVQGAINWITKYQRADDGIEQGPVGDISKRYEICWGRHSCHMGVAKTLKALSAIPGRRCKGVQLHCNACNSLIMITLVKNYCTHCSGLV